jgi:hypothetical protein
VVTKTVAIYVFFDGILKSVDCKEPVNRKTTGSEIATVILIAARYFGGNMETCTGFVCSTGLMPPVPDKSRFNRRMHKTGELPAELFLYPGHATKELNINHTYCIDSFPVSVCQNIRIRNSRMIKGEEYRGYCASKRSYFYGFKVHVIITSDGIPAEYTFTAGNTHDPDGMKQLPPNLSAESEMLAGSAYTDCLTEDMMADDGIRLLAARKSNSRKPHNPCTEYLIAVGRKRVETAFSDIAKLMPKKIHAVTQTGFLIKLIAFIWAYTFDKIYNL